MKIGNQNRHDSLDMLFLGQVSREYLFSYALQGGKVRNLSLAPTIRLCQTFAH